jgi:hypothetical protein
VLELLLFPPPASNDHFRPIARWQQFLQAFGLLCRIVLSREHLLTRAPPAIVFYAATFRCVIGLYFLFDAAPL